MYLLALFLQVVDKTLEPYAARKRLAKREAEMGGEDLVAFDELGMAFPERQAKHFNKEAIRQLQQAQRDYQSLRQLGAQ